MTKSKIVIRPSRIAGEIEIPSSKSHSVRAILFASMASGTSRLQKLLKSPDIDALLEAAEVYGAKVFPGDEETLIEGTGGVYRGSGKIIDCGNSGQILRFVGALASLSNQETRFTGDHSVCTNRPVLPLLKGITDLGGTAISLYRNDRAPILVRGPVTAGKAVLTGEDSQPVSALLMLAAFLEGETEIIIDRPGETSWIELTLFWLQKMGIPFERDSSYRRYVVTGRKVPRSFAYTVPGDFSSAAYAALAALLSGEEVHLHNLDFEDVQGDKALFYAWEAMGACFQKDPSARKLTIRKGRPLQGMTLDVNAYIDALPVLAVSGCFAEGTTRLVNAGIARHKESDRIACICRELKKMGADIEEEEEGLTVRKSFLHGGDLESYGDHRIALSLIVAALFAEGPSTLNGVTCIRKSYPDFIPCFQNLGAKISCS